MLESQGHQESYNAPRWAWWAATGLGSGMLRPAPGTWGSLAGSLAWFNVVASGSLLSAIAFEWFLGCMSVAIVFVSIVAAGLVVRQVGASDPSYIVSDEWAGVWLALWPVRHYALEAACDPWGSWKPAVMGMFAAFLLFRLFDIWKPWPIKKLESLPGGWGVTLDDVGAGIIAGLLLHVLMVIWPIYC